MADVDAVGDHDRAPRAGGVHGAQPRLQGPRHADHARPLGPAEQRGLRLGEEAVLARDRAREQLEARDAAPGGVLRVQRVGDQAAVGQVDVDAGAVAEAEDDVAAGLPEHRDAPRREDAIPRRSAARRAHREHVGPHVARIVQGGDDHRVAGLDGACDQRPGVALRASRWPAGRR